MCWHVQIDLAFSYRSFRVDEENHKELNDYFGDSWHRKEEKQLKKVPNN